MNHIVGLVLTLAIAFSYAEDRTCYRGEARAVFVEGGDFETFSARGRQQTCPTAEYGCGAVRKSGRSYQMNSDDSTVSGYRARRWHTLDLGCVPPALCEKVAGSTAGCRYADYSWVRWNPTSCNASDVPPYGLERYRQSVRMYYACCNEDLCNSPSRGSGDLNTTCTENTNLGEYITALHDCWNSRRLAFRKFFICDEEGPDLVDFRDFCSDTTYDEWDREKAAATANSEACYYRPTCSDELKSLIASFGECACEVAEEKGYTGELIGSLIESYWNDFCPDLEISCAGTGNSTLLLRQRRRRRRIILRVAKALDAVTDTWKAALREKIATYLRRVNSEDDITVSAEAASDGTRRRLLEDQSIITVDVFGDDAFDDSVETAACDETAMSTALGETVTIDSCDSSDEYSVVAGEEEDEATTVAPTATTIAPTTTADDTDKETSGASFILCRAALVVIFVTYALQ